MKKIYLKTLLPLAAGILLIHPSSAQNSIMNAEIAPISSSPVSIVMPNAPTALFDIQFSFLPEDSVPTVSIAGVGFTGTEIWVSRWNNNAIFRFTPTGSYIDSFAVTGVSGTSGVRSITFDGTNIWVSYNAATIKKIDPATRTVLATITPPALTGSANTAIRWITYDASLNSGAGGLWMGNYDTDISQIDMAGTLINSIPAGAHGLTGMYGAAFDNLSIGGPYLWVNSQVDPTGATTSAATIIQLDGMGMPTGVQHDVDADFGSAGGLAGGIFAGQLPGQTQPSILAVNQGTATVAYEITAAGIKKNDFSKQLSVNPNPSNGLFTIVNNSKITNADVTITNAKGEQVFTKHFDSLLNEKVDASFLPKGVYLVIVSNEKGKAVKKMVIQ